MRLKHFIYLRFRISDDGPCKKHTAGFSAYKTCAYHMTSYIEIVLRSKMLFYHGSHLVISGHHDLAHDIARIFHIHVAVILELRRIKKLIPEINVLIFSGTLEILQQLIKAATLNTVQDRSEIAVLLPVNMRKEHGLRITVPNLLGADIYIFGIGIHIKKQLCCIKDLVY